MNHWPPTEIGSPSPLTVWFGSLHAPWSHLTGDPIGPMGVGCGAIRGGIGTLIIPGAGPPFITVIGFILQGMDGAGPLARSGGPHG